MSRMTTLVPRTMVAFLVLSLASARALARGQAEHLFNHWVQIAG